MNARDTFRYAMDIYFKEEKDKFVVFYMDDITVYSRSIRSHAKIIATLRFSKWVANLVPVRKKNSEIRLCVDFRNLNKVSLKYNYPIPKMDHILKKVVGAERISTMDGFSGYNQIKVLPEDQQKNAFTTP